MEHAQWVFDCDAPLDEFRRRMAAALERQGWVVGTAQLHDFSAWRPGVRAFVKLAHHEHGVLVAAKLKPGLAARADLAKRQVWEAGREAQLGVAGAGAGGAARTM